MIIPDLNLLLYAEVDAFAVHAIARRWWERALNGSRQVGLAPVVVFGFIRIGTNRRVFDEPMTVEDATERVRSWFSTGRVVLLSTGSQYLETAFGLLEAAGTGANLTTDAQIAAHAIESNGEVYSNDSDFSRFEGLRWKNPLVDP